MSTVTAQPESREDALIRLADQARATGVKLFQDPKDGRFFASSRSQPGTYHRVTGFSCSCTGFIRRGRCAHLAALHAALGWLEAPEPTPPSSCPICHGTGTECGTVSTGPGKWAYESIVCATCHGTGTAVDTAA